MLTRLWSIFAKRVSRESRRFCISTINGIRCMCMAASFTFFPGCYFIPCSLVVLLASGSNRIWVQLITNVSEQSLLAFNCTCLHTMTRSPGWMFGWFLHCVLHVGAVMFVCCSGVSEVLFVSTTLGTLWFRHTGWLLCLCREGCGWCYGCLLVASRGIRRFG